MSSMYSLETKTRFMGSSEELLHNFCLFAFLFGRGSLLVEILFPPCFLGIRDTLWVGFNRV